MPLVLDPASTDLVAKDATNKESASASAPASASTTPSPSAHSLALPASPPDRAPTPSSSPMAIATPTPTPAPAPISTLSPTTIPPPTAPALGAPGHNSASPAPAAATAVSSTTTASAAPASTSNLGVLGMGHEMKKTLPPGEVFVEACLQYRAGKTEDACRGWRAAAISSNMTFGEPLFLLGFVATEAKSPTAAAWFARAVQCDAHNSARVLSTFAETASIMRGALKRPIDVVRTSNQARLRYFDSLVLLKNRPIPAYNSPLSALHEWARSCTFHNCDVLGFKFAKRVERGFRWGIKARILWDKDRQPPAPFKPLNPSVVRTPDGFELLCRTTDFERRGMTYTSKATDGKIHNETYWMRFSKDLTRLVEGPRRLVIPPALHIQYDNDADQGLQDCRFATPTEDEIKTETRTFTCSVYGAAAGQRVSMYLGRFSTRTCEVIRLSRVLGVGGSRPVEKNWLPFFDGLTQTLRAVYDYSEGVSLVELRDEHVKLAESATVDREVKTEVRCVASRVEMKTAPGEWKTNSFRGGGGPVPFVRPGDERKGFLVVVHEVLQFPDERHYGHRFLFYDAAWKLDGVSRMFAIKEAACVEFAAGLALQGDDKLLLSFGFDDSAALLMIVPFTVVHNLFGW